MFTAAKINLPTEDLELPTIRKSSRRLRHRMSDFSSHIPSSVLSIYSRGIVFYFLGLNFREIYASSG